jgi:Dyp-type peroxidase family
MEPLELTDIQGYIIRGYKYMMFSRYLLLNITDSALAKKFIHDITPEITNATHYPSVNCLNLVFTSAGLRAMGVNENNMQNFTREFREGMTTAHRQRLLGDFDSSAPENWSWGGTKNEELHVVLMVFGTDEETTLRYYERLKQQFSPGMKELFQLDGRTLPRNKEHFGFRDGISQPIIKGSGRTGPEREFINAGEFLMGYKNEYNVYPDTPVISDPQGNMNLLPEDASGTGCKDLGKNGSYMVLRQLQQDVNGFWSFMNERTKNEDGSINEDESVKLAAKMMGRWPSGTPIVKSPDKDPGMDSDDNEYDYKDDKDGLKCPFGSHMRRTNPRDSFEDNGEKQSLKLSNRHRIIRRARLYGEPYAGSPTNLTPEGKVGLLFTCFNADISRQFEFIQYTWANYPKVKQLYNDPDPIIGVREKPEPGTAQVFTIQQEPVNKCITELKSFVTCRGGAYCFFPSITTLKYLVTV